MHRLNERFAHFSRHVAHATGRPVTFLVALIIVLIWAATGPLFDYSETWQLIINTGTTVVTFLMVFVIQNSQDRDTQALHLKIDELIRVTETARDELIDMEQMPDDEMAILKHDFDEISHRAHDLKKET